jgi:2',3'-cyclic-nucleotide 2'-phosphodiesterase (5'-nucleotidase family)
MAYSGELIPMLTKDVTPDSELSALVDSIKGVIDKEYGVVIAQLKDNWETQYRSESNIGDWLTDAVRRHMGTDVAFLNSGGIRKDLAAGPVTKMDIYEILPFDNKIVTFPLTGAQLTKIAMHNIGLEKDSYQGTLQLSGLSYSWRGTSDRPGLVEVKVNGVPIAPDTVYSVATIDYVAEANAEKYFGFAVTDIKETDLALTQLVLEEVQKAGEISSKIDGRARKIE